MDKTGEDWNGLHLGKFKKRRPTFFQIYGMSVYTCNFTRPVTRGSSKGCIRAPGILWHKNARAHKGFKLRTGHTGGPRLRLCGMFLLSCFTEESWKHQHCALTNVVIWINSSGGVRNDLERSCDVTSVRKLWGSMHALVAQRGIYKERIAKIGSVLVINRHH